ncbi:MAG: DUF6600 domain-containing protein [Burkholderiaceae bacterium]
MLSLPACASDADRRAEGTESSTVRVISQAPAPVPPRATNGPGATNGPDANSAPSADATATDSGADAPQGTGPEASDVPLVAGRLGFVRGAVELWDPQSNGWRAAVLNETIGPRSALRTGADGRTEVSVGTSTLRLDGDSEVSWQRLDEERAEVEFDRGTMIVSRRSELGRPPPGASWAPENGSATPAQTGLVPIVIAVDAVSVTLSGPGSARLVHDAASRRLTVIASSGRAEVEHAGTRTALAAGQALALDTGSGAQVAATNTAGTEFESWSFERDRKASGSASYRFVSPAMTGAEVLDEHGRWQIDDSYGPIWYPTVVPASWAPYRVGQWSWVAPWGWTWVDEAPWGYAPFHYGRWAYVGNRWGWVPGAWVPRPVYAPALVGYYGGGATVSVSVGGPPGIGWFPLAPYEPWYPAYRYSPRYFVAVNPHTGYRQGRGPNYRPGYRPDGPPPRYRYADSPAAATLVSAPRFSAGNPMRNRIPTTADELRLLPVPARAARLPVPPTVGLPPARGYRFPQADRNPRPGSDDRGGPVFPGRQSPALDPRPAARPVAPPVTHPSQQMPQRYLFPRPGFDDLDRPRFQGRPGAPPQPAMPQPNRMSPPPSMSPPPVRPPPAMSPPPVRPPPPMSPPPMRAPREGPRGFPTPGDARIDRFEAPMARAPIGRASLGGASFAGAPSARMPVVRAPAPAVARPPPPSSASWHRRSFDERRR